MTGETRLFGKLVSSSYRLSLTEQVHDILCEEIQSGRWTVGERLPSIASLAEQSGLSRWPIQRAYEILREEGYVTQKPEKNGTFLASILPEGRKALGSIGIVALAEDSSDHILVSYSQIRLHVILQEAARRNYTTEIISLARDEDWSQVDSRTGPFGDRVKGVISLHSFQHPEYYEFPEDRIPLVYVGTQYLTCSPCVKSDPTYGYHQLTKRLIEEGHRRIIICCYTPLPSDVKEDCLKGHELAMSEAGLEVDYEAVEHSLSIPEGDLGGLRSFLERFSDATAIICMSVWRAQHLISVTDLLGISVPEELSVVSHGPGPMRTHTPTKTLTCLERNFEKIVKLSFDILIEQIETRRNPVGRILVKPYLIEGHSLAPPRQSGVLSVKTSERV